MQIHGYEEEMKDANLCLINSPPSLTHRLDNEHLLASDATTFMDLGMGTGKVALQAYFEHPNLKRVVGIELARSRWLIGKNALHRLVREFPEEFSFSDEEDSSSRNISNLITDLQGINMWRSL